MLLMVGKGIRGGIYHPIYRYVKVNNKCMKDYDKNKESLYLNYRDVDTLYRWEMSQKFPVGNFNPIQDGGAKSPPYQFFSCNFYKRRIWPSKLSAF